MLIEQFLENAYWQYFCGFEYFQHEFPCDPSSLTRWRKRMGDEGCKKLLSETLRLAHKGKLLKTDDLKSVVVDTTVQEKNISHPTDAKLINKAREKLVQLASERGIKIRQSYKRVGKGLVHQYSRYAHARQFNRAKTTVKKLKTLLGRVFREIDRQNSEMDEKLKGMMGLAVRLLMQSKDSKRKVYSLHEPYVECIAKGKSRTPYEFGCKTSLVTTVKSCWVIGVKSFHENPYDGQTLKDAVLDAEATTGAEIKNIFVDKGYRGKKYHPKDKLTLISGRKGLRPVLQRMLKRRSSIEPIIGHVKHEHRMSRNFLKGKLGDQLNAILAGTAFNFRKLLRALGSFFGKIYIIIFEIRILKMSPIAV
jgi:IS5 family transposase